MKSILYIVLGLISGPLVALIVKGISLINSNISSWALILTALIFPFIYTFIINTVIDCNFKDANIAEKKQKLFKIFSKISYYISFFLLYIGSEYINGNYEKSDITNGIIISIILTNILYVFIIFLVGLSSGLSTTISSKVGPSSSFGNVATSRKDNFGNTIYQDKNGKIIGRAIKGNFGTIIQDEHGNNVGSAVKGNFGTLFKDEKGNIVGSAREGNLENTIYRDEKGNVVGTSRKGNLDNTIYRKE